MATGETPDQRADDVDPIDAVAELVAAAGAHARPLRETIALLSDGVHTLASLIRVSAVSRRGVEELLVAIEPDLVHSDAGMRLAPGKVAAYRERFGYDQLNRTRPADPFAAGLAANEVLVAELDRLIAAAPVAKQSLDHVSATAETIVRRALWLDATFDLAGSRLLFVGDHDLTSLAVARLNPAVSAAVADLDDRLLEFIDGQAGRHQLDIRCHFADFRFGLPGALKEWADLLITDPPYTPEGMQLFLARGLGGLRDRERGRLVVAYGFGERHPALGLKVQQAVQGLHLTYEAILPHFNRYVGAQAIGSASDLYVCRPTARTWRTFDDPGRESGSNIYTHGPQSLEGADSAIETAVADALCEAAAGDGRGPVTVVADAWKPAKSTGGHVRLRTLMSGGLPTAITRRRPVNVAVDLSADPGPWLLRALLAVNADRVAVLVPGNHPDLAGEQPRQDLSDLLERKYRLRFHRGRPDSRYAIVEAVVADAPADPAGALVRRLLDRAHGKIANVWREGIVRASGLTKNEARELVRKASRRGDTLDGSLLELPRHQLRTLLDDVAGSAPDGT